MSNMSYCRFQNTLDDLMDCKEALDEMTNWEEQLSGDEHRAMLKMVQLCGQIYRDYGMGDVDEDQ